MIIAQKRLEEIFTTLPEMVIGTDIFNVRYGAGDHDELLAWLKLEEGTQKYPLIWCIMPFSEKKEDELGINQKLSISLILATLNRNVSMLNPERWDKSYALVLYPLFKRVKEALQKANITSVEEDNEAYAYNIMDFPNYSGEDDSEHNTPDIWDAIKISFTVTINSNCLRPINYSQ